MARFSKRALSIVVSPDGIYIHIFAFTSDDFILIDQQGIPADGIMDAGLLINTVAVIQQLQALHVLHTLTNVQTYCIVDRISFHTPALIECQWRMACHNSGLPVHMVTHYSEWPQQMSAESAIHMSRHQLELEGF